MLYHKGRDYLLVRFVEAEMRVVLDLIHKAGVEHDGWIGGCDQLKDLSALYRVPISAWYKAPVRTLPYLSWAEQCTNLAEPLLEELLGGCHESLLSLAVRELPSAFPDQGNVSVRKAFSGLLRKSQHKDQEKGHDCALQQMVAFQLLDDESHC